MGTADDPAHGRTNGGSMTVPAVLRPLRSMAASEQRLAVDGQLPVATDTIPVERRRAVRTRT
jgi:hypothetical protein